MIIGDDGDLDDKASHPSDKIVSGRPQSAGSIRGKTSGRGGPLMSKTLSVAPGKDRKKKKVQVVTEYSYMGATMATVQTRAPVAHRVENIWCRSDVGEWAGLTTKGRAMKKFESQDRFVSEAKRKIEERAELQRLLRAAVLVDYIDCDVTALRDLLQRSEKFRGSALDLDILKAEKYLDARRKAILAAVKIQRHTRGFSTRLALWIANTAKRNAYEKAMATEEQAAILCSTLVPEIINAGLAKQSRSQAHAQFKMSTNLGGVPMLVSVYVCARGLRKSENLCKSCLTQSFVRRYNPLKHVYYNDRAPCTCVLVQTREKWSIDFYDPISSTRFVREVNAEELKTRVEMAYEISKKLPQDHMRALFGSNFGKIAPLMGQKSNATPRELCEARLAASREYSVVAVMPRSYSSNLLSSMKHLRLPPEIADVFAKHQLRGTKNPIIVNDINDADSFIPNDAADTVSWEPLKNFIHCRYQGRVIELVLPVMQEYAEVTMRAYMEKKVEVYQHRINEYERACMEYEEMRSVIVATTDAYNTARQTVTDVMKFSKDGLEKFEAEERGDQEDWAQAWEAKEDANRWIGLNNVSKLRVLLQKRQKQFATKVVMTQVVLDRHAALLKEEMICKRLAENDSSVIENYKVFIQSVRRAVAAARDIALEAVTAVVSGMSLHTTLALETSRRVRFPVYKLAYIREQAKRVQVEYRSGWNMIARKVLVLRPHPGFTVHIPGRKCRCIVTVYRDPVAKNYILTVDSDDDHSISTEESTMHLDYCYPSDFFSPVSKFSRPNEIALAEEEFALVLEKVHSWPENIRKAITTEKFEASTPPKPDITETQEVELTIAEPSQRKESTRFRRPHSAQTPLSPARPRRATERPVTATGLPAGVGSTQTKVRHASMVRKADRPGSANQKDRRPLSARRLPPLATLPSQIPTLSKEEEIQSPGGTGAVPGGSQAVSTQASPAAPAAPPKETLVTISCSDDTPESVHPITTSVTIIQYNAHRMKYCPPGSYHQRRQNLKNDTAAVIKRLMKHLRLHPHSLRPMLGLLHLKRRMKTFREQFIKSLWMRDILRKFPHSWSNDFCHDKLSVISRRPLIAKMRDSWGDIVVKVRTPFAGRENGGFEAQMVVPFQKIVKSLIKMPILLASLLCETITNKYSLDTIRSILNCIDLELPGEEKRWWRCSFAREKTPTARFVESDDEKYRGVVYACHRFVSKRYCSVRVFKSCLLDLKIVLAEPTNGMFPVQSLRTDTAIVMIISADAIKAFLLKKMNAASSLVKKQHILNLWHPTYFHELITFILDNVKIGSKVMLKRYASYTEDGVIQDDDSSIASSLPELREEDEYQRDMEDEESLETPEVVTTWRQKLKIQLYRTIEMFNAWAAHYNNRVTPIDKNTTSELFTSLREYEVPPRWSIAASSNSGNDDPDKIFVYDGFWPAMDPRRVMRRSFRLMDSYMSLSAVILPGRENEATLPVESSMVSQESIFVEDSYWRVIMSTNQEKSVVEVDLHETDLADPSVQSDVPAFELEAMAIEDKNSRSAARLELEVAMLRDEGMVRYKTPCIPSHYVSMIATAKEKNEVMKMQLRKLQTNVLSAADAFMDKAALCAYKICIDSLEYQDSDTYGKQFLVDKNRAGDLGNHRKGKKPPLSVFVNNRYSIEYRIVDSNYTSHARAQESHVLTVAASKWLQKLERELIDADCVSVPSRLYQANNVRVKAYPGMEPPYRADRDVDGKTSALGVGKVRSSKDPDQNRSFFRNGISFARIRPSRAWEVGPLQDLHSNFLQRAQKGTRPHIATYGNDMYMVSAPNVGPFDIASVHLYAPRTRERHVVCFSSNLKLPRIGGLGKLKPLPEDERKKLTATAEEKGEEADDGDDGDVSEEDDGEDDQVEDHDDMDVDELEYQACKTDSTDIAMAKICARRVVWRSMIHGVTSATVREVEKLIDASLIRLERQVAYECNKWFPQVTYKHPKTFTPPQSDDDSISSEVQLPPQQQERLVMLKKFAPTLLNKNLSAIRKASEGHIDLSRYANVQLFAVYVPANEDVAPTVFDTTASFEWQSQCYDLLGCTISDPPIRVVTMPGLLYFAPSSAVDYFEKGADLDDGQSHNLRLSRFIYEYIANHGWRKGLAFIRHKNILARERTLTNFVEAPHIVGNTVMLFRHGEEDMHLFMKWCKDRYDLRQEQLERRRMKELADSRTRRENYCAWKRAVSGLANLYWPHVVKYFALDGIGYKFNAAAGDDTIGLTMCIENVQGWHVRTLLSAHAALCITEEGRQAMAEELRLMDSKYVFASSSIYMRFRNLKSEEFDKGEWFLSFEWDKIENPESLQPTAVQVIYALYLNHCSVCTLPSGSCRIPGCGIIRNTCGYCAEGSNAFRPADEDLGGCGDHPLEVAIKQYLLEYCDFSRTILPHKVVVEHTEVALAEPSHGDESTINLPEILAAADQTIVWREVEAKALNYRYINRRIQHPSITSYVSAEDVLDAKGGHDNREEEAMAYEVTSGLTMFLPPVGGITLERAESYSFHDEQSSFHSMAASIRSLVSSAGIRIPTSLIQRMVGMGSNGSDVTVRDMCDPCPPSSLNLPPGNLERVNSMSNAMYNWIVKHVRITRAPAFLINAGLGGGTDGAGPVGVHPHVTLDSVFESNESDPDAVALQFDRLHKEALTHAKDGSPIVVQVLHGVLKAAMRSADPSSGCPEAARRYLIGDRLPQLLENGLTVHVHDLSSNVSKVILLEKRLLCSFANQYGISNTNYPALATGVVNHAREVIAIHRMDGVCVGASLSLNGVSREAPCLVTPSKYAFQTKHISRRYTVVDKQNMRMLAASALLSSFSSEDRVED